MRKKIENCLWSGLFLLLLAMMIVLASLVLQPKDNREEVGFHDVREWGFLAEPANTLDVYILGDSLAECAFNPLCIWENSGITCYVSSGPNQKPFEALELLEEFLQRQNPKMVILEADMLYSKYDPEEPISHEFEKQIPLVRYHDRWKQLRQEDFLSGVNYTYVEQARGFYPTDTHQAVRKARMAQYMVPSDVVKRIRPINDEYVRRLADLCRENGVQLVLMNAPTIKEWNWEKHNGAARLAGELGAEYIDMNTFELGIDWKLDTRDRGEHLNRDGAQKVSVWLADYLTNTQLFRDKRSDADYAQWNADAAQFAEQMNKKG